MNEQHTCQRRDDNAAFGMSRRGGDNEDRWRDDRNDVRTCSYCGSLHPDDFMRLASEGAKLGPTDKNYKVYVDVPEKNPDEMRVVSAITFDPPPEHGTWEKADKDVLERDGWRGADYRWMQLSRRGPTAFGKFYFQHLSIEQRVAFVELLNKKALNIDGGRFYRLPFFCVPATKLTL